MRVGKISILHVTIEMKFSPDVNNKPSDPYMQETTDFHKLGCVIMRNFTFYSGWLLQVQWYNIAFMLGTQSGQEGVQVCCCGFNTSEHLASNAEKKDTEAILISNHILDLQKICFNRSCIFILQNVLQNKLSYSYFVLCKCCMKILGGVVHSKWVSFQQCGEFIMNSLYFYWCTGAGRYQVTSSVVD